LGANVSRDPLQSHYRYRSSIFRDASLFCVHHIHDDAAFEHLGHTAFNACGSSYMLLSHGKILLRNAFTANLALFSDLSTPIAQA
jgi:hypothetical protein